MIQTFTTNFYEHNPQLHHSPHSFIHLLAQNSTAINHSTNNTQPTTQEKEQQTFILLSLRVVNHDMCRVFPLPADSTRNYPHQHINTPSATSSCSSTGSSSSSSMNPTSPSSCSTSATPLTPMVSRDDITTATTPSLPRLVRKSSSSLSLPTLVEGKRNSDDLLMGNCSSRSHATNISSSSKTNNSSKTRQYRRRSVGFSTLQVFEFEQILGDNPAVSSGAPVTLEWKHCSSSPNLNIAYFEYKRQQPRRTGRELVTSASSRESLLQSKGYTTQEIQQAAKRAATIRRKRQRQQYTGGKNWDKLHIAWESFSKR